MDRLTRKELKTDKFAAEIGHTVAFLDEHRKQASIIGGVLLVLLIGAIGVYYYVQHQHSVRQTALHEALRVFDGQISPTPNAYFVTFATQQEKDAATDKALQDVISTYGGTDEATIATFYLGLSANNQGRTDDAQKYLREAVDSGNQPYASQAALSLAQLQSSLGLTEQAEKLLRNLVENPTVLVSKEQATIALARVVAKRDTSEARKLLEPLRTERGTVSRVALTALGELPQDE